MSNGFDHDKNLESFLRKQEKLIKENEKYSRFMFVPVVVIVISVLVLLYNFTAGRNVQEGQISGDFEIKAQGNALEELLSDKTFQIISGGSQNFAKSKEDAKSNRINLNTATVSELDTLPGIGTARAKAIVKLREEMGGFKSVEDVLNVNGIGYETLEKFKELVFVK